MILFLKIKFFSGHKLEYFVISEVNLFAFLIKEILLHNFDNIISIHKNQIIRGKNIN